MTNFDRLTAHCLHEHAGHPPNIAEVAGLHAKDFGLYLASVLSTLVPEEALAKLDLNKVVSSHYSAFLAEDCEEDDAPDWTQANKGESNLGRDWKKDPQHPCDFDW